MAVHTHKTRHEERDRTGSTEKQGLARNDAVQTSRAPNPTALQRAATNPRDSSPQEILQLQRTIGNRATARAIESARVQRAPAPVVGATGAEHIQRTGSKKDYEVKKGSGLKVKTTLAKGKKGEYDAFHSLMANSSYRKSFKAYCLSEWSAENILAYEDILKYKKGPSRAQAENIQNLYFQGDASLYEVNVAKKQTDAIKATLIHTEGQTPPKALFDDVLGSVELNLLDTYSRWILQTPQGIQFDSSYKEQMEAMSKAREYTAKNPIRGRISGALSALNPFAHGTKAHWSKKPK